MSLPTEATARKAIPVYSGFVKYFPLAIAAVAELSRKGNDQHNPGKPLHWDRSKSGDELDALMRHMLDEANNVPVDTDDVLHLTKMAWRAMAQLQKRLEVNAEGEFVNVTPVPPNPWHDWDGGGARSLITEKYPAAIALDPSVVVEFKLRSGSDVGSTPAHYLSWWHGGLQSDIIAWRFA